MADDDYGTDISEDEAFDTAKANGADVENQPANTDAPRDDGDTGGEMHTDPNDKTPEIPDDQDPSKADPYGNASPMTPQEKMQHSLDQYKAARQSMDALDTRTRPMWEKYRQMAQQDQDMAEQGDTTKEQPYPEPPSKQKQTWLGAVTQLLSVAIPIAMMFGIKGNGFAKGAMMSAIGSFIKNYTAGRDQAAKQDWTEWKDQVQAIHQSNQQRHQIYKDVLANKRLALDDQFKMIHAVSSEFLDPSMMKAARTNDMKAIIKHLENQQKADQRFVKGANKVAKTIRPRDYAEYVQYMKDEHDIDPETDPQGADKVEKYTEWKGKQKTTAEKTREEKEEAVKEAKNPDKIDVHKTLFGTPSDSQ